MKKQFIRTISGMVCVCMLAASFSGCTMNEEENAGGNSVFSVNTDSFVSSVSSDISDDMGTSGSETSGGAAGDTNTEGKNRVTQATLPFYFFTAAAKAEQTFYFVDGEKDIPYISVNDLVELLNVAFALRGDTEFTLTVSDDNGVVDLEREINAGAIIDFNNKTLLYDYEDFFRTSYSSTPTDILSRQYLDENGESVYFKRSEDSFVREGKAIAVDFSAHNIEIIYENGVGYLPLQTANDLFISPNGCNLLYNGEMVAIIAGCNMLDLEDIYYSAPPRKRSEALAEFNYNELCLALEMNYGLKEIHNIDSFDTLFVQTGLDQRLKSEDAVIADQAIYELCFGHFADLHSGLLNPSFYAGRDADTKSDKISTAIGDAISSKKRYAEARSVYYPDGTPAYEEIGNTAYVTFDNFVCPSTVVDYYKTPADADSADTFGIIIYAHSQIMRENSPIENVVIDLSNNGGGEADAAIYMIGWFLGECVFNVNNTLTDGQASTRYMIDVNCDHKFDENDTVASKNLYCIISPNSFSCGNLVPSAFKSSGRVTLLGETSGGGACVVQRLTTADGTMFQVSGTRRISTISNGSFYDVDQGVDPDVSITKLKNFYNRTALTSYINALY